MRAAAAIGLAMVVTALMSVGRDVEVSGTGVVIEGVCSSGNGSGASAISSMGETGKGSEYGVSSILTGSDPTNSRNGAVSIAGVFTPSDADARVTEREAPNLYMMTPTAAATTADPAGSRSASILMS